MILFYDSTEKRSHDTDSHRRERRVHRDSARFILIFFALSAVSAVSKEFFQTSYYSKLIKLANDDKLTPESMHSLFASQRELAQAYADAYYSETEI
jgi:hypothetical protein